MLYKNVKKYDKLLKMEYGVWTIEYEVSNRPYSIARERDEF